MKHLGDLRLGDTFDTKFCTVDSTGLPTTLAGSPVVSAYVGNSTTELTAGITLSVDFDSRTGLHNVRVVATSGNGYATASNYQLVLTAGTVGGVSVVGYVIGEFSIEARSALMPTTAARTLDVTATGEAGIDWANIGGPTTAQVLSGTTVGTVNGLAANAITATSIQADAITAAKIADGAIDAATFAAGAINAAAIAADAITAAKIAADAGVEIAAAVWDMDATGHQTQGTFGQTLGDSTTGSSVLARIDLIAVAIGEPVVSVAADIAAVKSDTAAIKTDTTALVAGVSVTTGGIVSTSFAAGAIDAAAIAANAIGASELAADAIGASELAADAANEIADALLARNIAGGSSAGRTVTEALRRLRNRVAIAGGTATVYQEDDTASSWTAAVTTAAGNPVSQVDPA